MTVEVGTNGLDYAAIEDEFERGFNVIDQFAASGGKAWHSRYRWVGPVKFLAYKEVGPPPWRWPRIGIQPHGWRFVRFIIGWRSTAYALCVMWAGRRHA